MEERREVPTFWRHAVGPQPDAEQVGAAQQLRQALEAAESVEDPEQWDQCSECGDQLSSLCRFGRCVACCEMTGCGCASAGWRDQMRARTQSLSDSDLRSDDQPQWYQDWCSSDWGHGSSESSDELLPVQCEGCDESFVLGGGHCRVCREDGAEAKARRFCVAPVIEVDAGDDAEMEQISCVMCRAEYYKLQSAERICAECVAIATQPELVETPNRVTVVRNAVYAPPISEVHTEDVTARL